MEKRLLDSLTSQLLHGLKDGAEGGPPGRGAAAARRSVALTAVLALSALAAMVRCSGGRQGMSQGSFVIGLLAHCTARGPGPVGATSWGGPTGHGTGVRHTHTSSQRERQLAGWGVSEVAFAVHALAELRQPLPAVWAAAATRTLLPTASRQRGGGPAAQPLVSAVILLACALFRLHSRLRYRGVVIKRWQAAQSINAARPTMPLSAEPVWQPERADHLPHRATRPQVVHTSPSTGVPLRTWAHSLAPQLAGVNASTLAGLPASQLALFCLALTHLAGHSHTHGSARHSHVRLLLRTHRRAVAVAAERAAAGLVDCQQASLVLTSLAAGPGKLQGLPGRQARQVASVILRGELQPVANPWAGARAWCRILGAAGRLGLVAEAGGQLGAGCRAVSRQLDVWMWGMQGAASAGQQVAPCGLSVADCEVALSGLRALEAGADVGAGRAGHSQTPGELEVIQETAARLQAVRSELLRSTRQARLGKALQLLAR